MPFRFSSWETHGSLPGCLGESIIKIKRRWAGLKEWKAFFYGKKSGKNNERKTFPATYEKRSALSKGTISGDSIDCDGFLISRDRGGGSGKPQKLRSSMEAIQLKKKSFLNSKVYKGLLGLPKVRGERSSFPVCFGENIVLGKNQRSTLVKSGLGSGKKSLCLRWGQNESS